MNAGFSLTPALDLFPLIAGVLACVGCGLLGNFLVLRRLSLMGDAISHAVLPGLVVAFLVTQSRHPLAMFVGATVAGLCTVVLVELIKKLGRIEPGAAMGVVFTVLFALGVLLIAGGSADNVELHADCVLHGQLEFLWWANAPTGWGELNARDTLAAVPNTVWTLLGMVTVVAAFTLLFFKELRLAAFDPQLADSLGFGSSRMHFTLMILVAGATVASFEAVGSILVIAMLIVPAATARLLTDRLATQVWCSVVVAVVTALGGYIGASAIPAQLGIRSVSAAGAMTVAGGGLLALTIFLAPRHGVLAKAWRRRRFAAGVAVDNLLADLFRAQEDPARPSRSPGVHTKAVRAASKRGLVTINAGDVALTERGTLAAAEVIRRHRLWEHYLVTRAGLPPDHVHDAAEQLEHLPDAPDASAGPTDPHGRSIPPRG